MAFRRQPSRDIEDEGGFLGPFHSWKDAVALSTGYSADDIFERTVNARLKVLNGEAAFERDSIVFEEPQYSWPLLAHLLWIASLNNGKLEVVDFGGSLGSTYYQNRKYLSHLHKLSWRIIEQHRYVEFGRHRLLDGHLTFHETWGESLQNDVPDLVLLSSLIMYMERPYEVLGNALATNAEFIIVDRTPVIKEDQDRLMVEVVPRAIFKARLPYWFLGENRFLQFMLTKYELIAEFSCNDHGECEFATYKGLVFRRKKVVSLI